MPRQLKNLRIDDVSSVDRGAGQGVRVVLIKRDGADEPYWKREFSQGERDEAANSGAALPDGSFPIKSKDDLKNAIQAIGRAKNPDKAKAHIKTRARALGATDMLPDEWQKRDASEELDMTITVNKDDLMNLISDVVKKALTDAGVPIEKMTPDHAAYHQHLDGDEAKRFSAMSHDDREKYVGQHPIKAKAPAHGEHDDGEIDPEPDGEEMGKALALIEKAGGKVSGLKRKKKQPDEPPGEGEFGGATKEAMAKHDEELRKANETNAELKKRVDALETDAQRTEFKKKAVEMGLPESDGDKLLKAHKGDPEGLKWLVEKVATQNKIIAKSEIFKEYGSNRPDAPASAYDELVAKGAELRKADPKLTVEQAFNKAASDPANAEIVQRERAERMAKINGRAAA